jgi:hypothetical protein
VDWALFQGRQFGGPGGNFFRGQTGPARRRCPSKGLSPTILPRFNWRGRRIRSSLPWIPGGLRSCDQSGSLLDRSKGNSGIGWADACGSQRIKNPAERVDFFGFKNQATSKRTSG